MTPLSRGVLALVAGTSVAREVSLGCSLREELASVDVDDTCALQWRVQPSDVRLAAFGATSANSGLGGLKRPRTPQADQTHRVRIKGTTLVMTDTNMKEIEVVPMGGNYVVKAQPYFPPEEVVRANAKSMYGDVQAMSYRPSDGRKVLPVVRLGAMMEGAMPRGPELDPVWVAALHRTVQIFAEEGVYVILDMHADAWAAPCGGEGFPAWMVEYMQSTSKDSFVISPEHPLRYVGKLLPSKGASVPKVTVAENDANPWFNYSMSDKEPWKMNVGNWNVRLNNNDGAWNAGVLPESAQSNNIAWRFYNSYRRQTAWKSHFANDRKRIFAPFVAFMKYLATVWQDNPNVIAIEVLNEPPSAGLPHLGRALLMRRQLFAFYGALLQELDDVPAVYALEDISGTVPGSSPLDAVVGFAGLSYQTQRKIQERVARGQLMYSFHYYWGASTLTFEEQIKAARRSFFGNMPLFLSEYWDSTSAETARKMSIAAEMGVNAVTYWHYVDSNYTQNDGWFKYPPSVQSAGGPEKTWADYLKTVEEGTYWGAAITGGGGGKSDVMRQVAAPVDVVKKVERTPQSNYWTSVA